MGMLGGLGRGLTQYAETLGRQREMDWKAQQAELAAQREQNLQQIRLNAQKEENALQREFTGNENQLTRNTTIEQNRLNREATAEQNRLNREHQEGMLGKKTEQEVESAKAQAKARFEVADEVTKEKMIELKESDFYKNATPAQQDYMEANLLMNGQVDFKDLTKGTKLKAPDSATLKQVVEIMSEDKTYANSPPSVKIFIANKKALEITNPDLAKSGTIVIPDKEVENVARDVLDNKMNVTEFNMLDVMSQQKVLKAMGEVSEDTKIEKQKEAKRASRTDTVDPRVVEAQTGGNQYGTATGPEGSGVGLDYLKRGYGALKSKFSQLRQ